jgi:hypothetical protein
MADRVRSTGRKARARGIRKPRTETGRPHLKRVGNEIKARRIDFRDGAVHVSAGEMFVVLKGVEHKPYAEREVKLLLIEPRGVLNIGDEGGGRTAENDVRI